MWVRNAGEGELKGTVVSHHPNIEIAPATIDGNENRFVYWVDPDQSGSSAGHIQIKTEHEERSVPTWRLMPRSYFAGMTTSRLAGLLLAPGLLGTLYCMIVFLFTSRWARLTLQQMLGDNYDRYLSSSNPLSLRQSGVGGLDLQIVPRVEASVLVFFLLSWLVPTIVYKLYQSYPRHAQLDLSTLFTFALMLPSLLFAGLYYTPLSTGPIFEHPELNFLDFRQHLTHFMTLNLAVSGYYFLELSGFWRRYLNRLGRFALSTLLLGAYLALLVYLVYGRSWALTG